MSNETKPAETLASFRKALATALIAAAKAESLRHTRANDIGVAILGQDIVQYGADPSSYTVPDFPEETHIGGVPVEDLTEAAKAKHNAKQLRSARANAYREIRRQVRYGYLSEESAVAIVTAVNLPQPQTKTRVSVYVTGWGSKEFTVPGTVDAETVKGKFANLVNDPETDKVRELFPDATGLDTGLTVYVNTERQWPDMPAE